MKGSEPEELSDNRDDKKIGTDVYESARKLNTQLATRGPAVLYALSKTSEQVTNSLIVTAMGGMVLGAFGFFGNRYYRNKGEDSAYSYMGQIVGAVQFTAGFMLLVAEGLDIYINTGEVTPLFNTVKLGCVALTLLESAMVLVNSYLYGDGSPKEVPVYAPKID